MKQVMCECGRVAEVRRRKNGKHLRYKHCKVCGTDLCNTEGAKRLEEKERDDIGVYGEFHQKPPELAPNTELESVSGDWVPDSETLPEISENDSEPKTEVVSEKAPVPVRSIIRAAAWGVVVIGAGLLGYSVSKNNVASGGNV